MTKTLQLKGTARTILTHSDGTVETFEQHNMIVNVGFNFIISSMINSGNNRPNPMGYIALGTSNTAASVTDTTLGSETYRKAGTWSWTSGSKTFTITASWAQGAVTGTIREAGVFNASSGGTMLDHIIFSTPFTGSSDIQYTQQFEFEVA